MSELLKILPAVRGIYRTDAELKNWFNITTKAEVLFRPKDIEDLQFFLKNISKEISVTVLGAASNVIIKDSGIAGVVIRLGGEFAKISHKENLIEVGAACLCGNAALYSQNAALTDLEFLSGIPGSIGGALAMNAGCYGSDMSQVLVSAKAVDLNGDLAILARSDFEFAYRENKIAKKYIFVEATLKGSESSSEVIAKNISDLNKKREEAQPIRAKTGGSTFKNPSMDSSANIVTTKKAWELIDAAGCRGLKENDAQISEKHCNFMINNGNASAQNLIDLGNKVQKLVKEKTGISLEWEIKILG